MPVVLVGCYDEPTAGKVVGTYVGAYWGGTETITFRSDGTYRQVFTKGNIVVYDSGGRWEVDEERAKLWVYRFKFVGHAGMFERGKPFTEYAVASLNWNGGDITFDAQENEVAFRQGTPPRWATTFEVHYAKGGATMLGAALGMGLGSLLALLMKLTESRRPYFKDTLIAGLIFGGIAGAIASGLLVQQML